MNARQEKALSFEELVEQENRSPIRHEYIGGKLYAMAGGTPRHADIGHNLQVAVGRRLDDSACRGSSNDQRVRVTEEASNWYYPDFLIKCPPERYHPNDKIALLNPRAIFEVLSPDTEKFDRTGKFDEYKKIVELSDYILVDTEVARVEHFARGQNGKWEQSVYTLLSQELKLDNFSINVPLAEIYKGVEVSEQSILPIELSEFE
jgi:Uma2 family endonuclease